MKIKLIYQGKEQIIDNVSIGGYIITEYVKSDNEKIIYHLIIN